MIKRLSEYLGAMIILLFVFNSVWIFSGADIGFCKIGKEFGYSLIKCTGNDFNDALSVFLNAFSYVIFLTIAVMVFMLASQPSFAVLGLFLIIPVAIGIYFIPIKIVLRELGSLKRSFSQTKGLE